MASNDSLREYKDLLHELSDQDRSAARLPPGLVLNCKTAETASILVAGMPASVRDLLAGEVEVYQFGDGTGAVKFPLKTGAGILGLLGSLGQGHYSGPLRITGGMAIRLPAADRQSLRQFVNTQNLFGIGRTLEDEDFWWW